MAETSIEWTDKVWNVTRGCSRVSPGCGGARGVGGCYAERQAARFSGPGQPYEGLVEIGKQGPRWTGRMRFVAEKLTEPLGWSRSTRVFVDSMSDLFHDGVSKEEIAAVYGVMAACPDHVFQVLTKRSTRMRECLSDPDMRDLIDTMRHVAQAGRIVERFAPEREAPIDGWPGYFVTSTGRVMSSRGSETCVWCGAKLGGIAKQIYCSGQCRSKADYGRRTGRWSQPSGTRRQMATDACPMGHARVMMYSDSGEPSKHLVSRLVLEAFDRKAVGEEQACHITGDASNNALWNLRWGSQASNWDDSKRHGTRRRHFKLTKSQVDEIRQRSADGASATSLGVHFGISDTQVRNIVSGRQWSPEYAPIWPLPQAWEGVSVESPEYLSRIDDLRATPAAVRFLSLEPLLADLGTIDLTGIHWVIAGGESGPGARQMHPDWVRSIRDQCAAAGVPFFFKQHGGVLKKKTGRVLDGRTHDAMPARTS